MKRIVWLASYPKSGNTWFRVFLANLLRNQETPVRINAMKLGWFTGPRLPFDDALGYDSSEMTPAEIDRLRPEAYLYQANCSSEAMYYKVHDAYTFLADGRPMFPPEATRCVLYFIRNPLDVCVSLSHHHGVGLDSAIRALADPELEVRSSSNQGSVHLRQKIQSWSRHVLSWVDAPGQHVQVVRYEDMKRCPQETFSAAARFAGLPDDPERIRRAVEFSRFEELSRQEGLEGFIEKSAWASRFFRKGEIGSWREALSPEQVESIITSHAPVMRRFGYLDDKGRPVF